MLSNWSEISLTYIYCKRSTSQFVFHSLSVGVDYFILIHYFIEYLYFPFILYIFLLSVDALEQYIYILYSIHTENKWNGINFKFNFFYSKLENWNFDLHATVCRLTTQHNF